MAEALKRDEPAGAASGPIVAPRGESAATASRPDTQLDDRRYHIYEANPAPWWIALLWAAFLLFGATYLIVNLLG
jgi:hypothetical protein